MSTIMIRRTVALTASAILVLLTSVTVAQATPSLVKLVQTGHFPAGFEYGHGVAVNNDPASAEHGDVYVVDLTHSRIQVFSATGTFVEMFGKEINSGTPKNICKAGETCNPSGVGGSEAGQFATPLGIAIDPSSGDVYVDEFTEEGGQRVQAFTAEGQFLFEIGREVNPTAAQKNVCTQLEIEKGTACAAPKETPEGSIEEGAFRFGAAPDLLAVGGPKDLLFVGDENRVQEFNATTGAPAKQILLTSIGTGQVQALALDQTSGDVYLLYPEESSGVIRWFAEGGSELGSFAIKPRIQGEYVYIGGMALDPSGRLAVVEYENGSLRGSLYDPASGKRITGFSVPSSGLGGMAFDGEGHLYIGEGTNYSDNGEVFSYTPEPIAELTLGAGDCVPGPVKGSLAVVDCTLHGAVNPEGVAETEAFFEYGRTTALGEKTPLQPVAASGPVQAIASGLRPNETYYYQLAGYDANVKPPEEAFTTEEGSLATQAVPPIIVGEPTALGVRAASATLLAELNPENARSEYFFEYGTPEALAKCARGLRLEGSCPGVLSTPVTVSSVYGQIGAKAEISGLQSGTTYGYRLFAEDESRTKSAERFQAIGAEGRLMTPPPPNPSAQTGGPSTVTATSAVISGTVNPDGQQAGYEFELGVYNGAATQYTIVQSGSAGSSTEPIAEAMTLTGLQPGTTYAYRIAITSAYVKNEAHTSLGAVGTFTTAGIPAVLASPAALPVLAVPNITFPKEAKVTPKKLTRAQQLANALKACARKPKSKRAACRRAAQKKYGPSKTKAKKK